LINSHKRMNIIIECIKKHIAPHLYLGRQFHLFFVIGLLRIFDILIRTYLRVYNAVEKACVAILRKSYHIFN